MIKTYGVVQERLSSLCFCFWWDARSGRINAPSRFIHVKIFCSFRPQTSLELGTTNKSRREQKSTLLERLLKLSPHKFILRAVCQDSAHTHTQTETVGGGGLRVRAEQLSDVGFWVEKGGSFLGEVGEAVRSCRRGQIAVELQPTFIWSRREFCRLSGVGFWFTLWQEPTENTHELFLKSRKRVLQHAAAAQPLLLNHRCTHHVKCWLRSAGF